MRRSSVLALTLLGACRHTAPDDPAELRRAISASTAAYVQASRAGDAHALAQLYDEHAVLLPPEAEPVEGRDSIEAYWRRGLESGFDLHTTRVEAAGGVAYSIGQWTLPATGEESADSGRLVLCWKWIDGRWRLTADIWNSSVPADSTDEGEPGTDRIPVS